MPFDLVRENIMLSNNRISEETSQIIVESDVIVADTKPDIAKILRVSGISEVTETKVLDDRVSYKGRISLNTLYLAQNGENTIYSINSEIPFEDFINMDGVSKSTRVSVSTAIDRLDHKLINDRKIGIKALLSVYAVANEPAVMDIVKDILNCIQMQTQKKTITVNNTVDNLMDTMSLKTQFEIDNSKPQVRELLLSDANIANKDIMPFNGGVKITGEVLVSVLYIGDSDEAVVDIIEERLPFEMIVDSSVTTVDSIVEGDVKGENVNIRILPDDSGEDRIVDVSMTLVANLDVIKSERIAILDDAYSLNEKININRENINYKQYVGQARSRNVIEDTVSIEDDNPSVLRVSKIWGESEVSNIDISENQLHVDGNVALEILYVASDDESPINITTATVPFTQVIEVAGAMPGMLVDLSTRVANVDYTMLGDRQIQLRIAIDLSSIVTNERMGTVITNIEESEESNDYKNMASVVIYTVQPGDTLWSIAKTYNTTIEDIVTTNEIETVDTNIYTGEKLLILKRVY